MQFTSVTLLLLVTQGLNNVHAILVTTDLISFNKFTDDNGLKACPYQLAQMTRLNLSHNAYP